MLLRAAGHASSSWSHRRAPTYLRRSHTPLNSTYKHLPLREWRSVASGCPSKPKGTKWTIAASLQMSCRAYLLLLFVTTHCPDRLWNRPADDPPPATPTPPPAHIAADSQFALRFHSEDKRICGSQTKSSNQNCVLRGVTIVQPFN